MSESNNICIVGECFNEKCKLYNLAEQQKLLAISSLKEEDIQLLRLRLPDFEISEKGHICQHHCDRYLKYFSSYEKKCVDPFNKHTKYVRNNLRILDRQEVENIKEACDINLVVGKKICINCIKDCNAKMKAYGETLKYCFDPFDKHRAKIPGEINLDDQLICYIKKVFDKQYSSVHKVCYACRVQLKSGISIYENVEVPVTEESPIESNTQSTITENSIPNSTESTSTLEYTSSSQKKRKLDSYLEIFNISPFKRQKLSDSHVVEEGVNIVQEIVSKVSNAFQEVNNVELPDNFQDLKETHEQSLAFDKIISNLLKKYSISTFSEKISILALLPDDWKFQKIQKHFRCSFYMFSEAKKLKQQGPKCRRTRKKYLRVSPEIRKEIIKFYLNDKNSVKCSGMKELKKVHLDDGSSTKTSERILLYDLKVLYNDWVKETKQTKIPCFAFFCQMKPEEYVFAGAPGTHNVCVCDRHQNLKLKLAASKVQEDYREVIAASVCSINNKSCMLHQCEDCPGKEGIREFLDSHIKIEQKAHIQYSNWANVAASTNSSENSSSTRMTMRECEESYTEFVDNLIEDVWTIKKHHFISSEQKKYYSYCKDNVDKVTGVIVMDFAENYSFIVQDSAQAFYFNNSQASLFTVTLYYRNPENNEIEEVSCCVISDSTKHQAYSVHIFQEAVLNRIKNEFSFIKNLIYFSDGAPTQFKNKNHFINLCHHEEDFGIRIKSYNFFATSHGKSACDGIGAVAKGTARKASLQKVKILDAREMYNYLNEKESSIRYCFVTAKEVESREKKLLSRFKSANTLPNTREYHRFEPLNKNQMIVRFFSNDTDVEIENLK